MPVPRAMMHLIPTLRRVLESLATSLEGVPSDGSAVDYADFEHVVAQQLRCVEQAMHASMLQKLDVDSDTVRIWGSAYKRVGRYEGEYYCLAGPVRVMRSIYRKVGDRHGKTIDAVSLRSGAVADGWLPRTAQAMAHLLAQGTSREAQTISAELLRLPYSRSSFERVGHEVAKRYRQGHPRIETGLIEAYEVPDETKSVSVSIDRVSLPMEELPPPVSPRSASIDKALADLRASGTRTRDVDARTQASIDNIRAQSDKHKPVIERNFRMAYCATVTLHDGAGDALHTIRYGRMPQGDVKSMMQGLARDVKALRAKRPDLRVVFLADGAAELWNLYERYLSERDIGVRATRLIDCWHVTEYLAAAARLMESRKKAWPGQLDRWKKMLHTRALARHTILAELQQSGLENAIDIEGHRAVGDAIRYISKRLPMMRYAAAHRIGLPVGSGNVEATCKSLVALRMKRPGARWKSTTGEDVLHLRALVLSDRWTQAIPRALKSLRKPVRAIGQPTALAA